MATVLFFIVYPAREIRNFRRHIEDETASDLNNYNIYMNTGTFLLFTQLDAAEIQSHYRHDSKRVEGVTANVISAIDC